MVIRILEIDGANNDGTARGGNSVNFGDQGGAIYLSGGTLTATSCTFNSNHAVRLVFVPSFVFNFALYRISPPCLVC